MHFSLLVAQCGTKKDFFLTSLFRIRKSKLALQIQSRREQNKIVLSLSATYGRNWLWFSSEENKNIETMQLQQLFMPRLEKSASCELPVFCSHLLLELKKMRAPALCMRNVYKKVVVREVSNMYHSMSCMEGTQICRFDGTYPKA